MSTVYPVLTLKLLRPPNMIYKIEDLLDMSADKLEAMSDDELKKHFEQYLDVVRPERAKVLAPVMRSQPSLPPAKRKMLSNLAAMGVDMSLFAKRKK